MKSKKTYKRQAHILLMNIMIMVLIVHTGLVIYSFLQKKNIIEASPIITFINGSLNTPFHRQERFHEVMIFKLIPKTVITFQHMFVYNNGTLI